MQQAWPTASPWPAADTAAACKLHGPAPYPALCKVVACLFVVRLVLFSASGSAGACLFISLARLVQHARQGGLLQPVPAPLPLLGHPFSEGPWEEFEGALGPHVPLACAHLCTGDWQHKVQLGLHMHAVQRWDQDSSNHSMGCVRPCQARAAAANHLLPAALQMVRPH